jgi:hypothetical protein
MHPDWHNQGGFWTTHPENRHPWQFVIASLPGKAQPEVGWTPAEILAREG